MEAWLYVDGASRGNPGHAGAGVLICDRSHTVLASLKRYLGQTTNNVAEYKALVLGLKRVMEMDVTYLHIRSDSELLVRQIEGIYRVRNEALAPLYQNAIKMLHQIKRVEIAHVPREMNKDADYLANLAIDSHLKRV